MIRLIETKQATVARCRDRYLDQTLQKEGHVRLLIMQFSTNIGTSAKTFDTIERYRLSSEGGRYSDQYYRAVADWLRKGMDPDSHAACQKISREYHAALDRLLEYLKVQKSDPSLKQTKKHAVEMRKLLEIDIKSFRLD